LRKAKEPEGRPVWEKGLKNFKSAAKPKLLGVKKIISTHAPLIFGI